MSPGEVKVIETNIDDMSGEIFGYIMERLMENNALDVWYTPVYMKKNRPGVVISVLCSPEDEKALADILLNETTTLGVRSYTAYRSVLNRQWKTVHTKYGDIRIKIAQDGNTYKAAPEYEDCKKAAERYGVSFREVYDAARLAYERMKCK
ncbi:MAG: LarC family nickel insertion protein [Caldicoprobacteraceae bacterium]